MKYKIGDVVQVGKFAHRVQDACAFALGEGVYRVDGIWWDERQLTPEPDPWVERVLLITYPELFICEKAGECGRGGCRNHRRPHAKSAGCAVDCCGSGPCIPYVPEDEADWFVARRASDAHGHGTKGLGGALLTKKGAELWVKDEPGYRAFKWSDGLKGGE
jgi:hypothetical protein